MELKLLVTLLGEWFSRNFVTYVTAPIVTLSKKFESLFVGKKCCTEQNYHGLKDKGSLFLVRRPVPL